MKRNVFAAMLILGLSTLTASSATGPQVPFKLTDNGNLTFTSQTAANLAGTGIGSHAGRGISAGTINVTGPASCSGGMSATINGTFTGANGDSISYTVHQQLCPTASQGVFAGVGSYTITGGTGRFANATGAGSFNGLGDFVALKYQCTLDGTISY